MIAIDLKAIWETSDRIVHDEFRAALAGDGVIFPLSPLPGPRPEGDDGREIGGLVTPAERREPVTTTVKRRGGCFLDPGWNLSSGRHGRLIAG